MAIFPKFFPVSKKFVSNFFGPFNFKYDYRHTGKVEDWKKGSFRAKVDSSDIMNLSLSKWIDYMKPFYLTISDITKLKPGETIRLLCLDRNVYYLADSIDNKTPKRAETFFSYNYQIIYTHSHDLQGQAEWIGLQSSSDDSDSDSEQLSTFWGQ